MRTFNEYFSTHKERFLAEWSEFLSFKSISTDPEYHHECLACAAWVRNHLDQLGFATEIWPSATKPLLYAVRKGNPAKPTVLFYGHYDVQPVDPIELWLSDPFTPVLRDGRMYARGAQDNKGQVFAYLKAIEASIALGVDLPTIKILIEGEEESGSEAMHAGLPGWSEPLKAEILMVSDTGMIGAGMPTITMGLRGIAHFEVTMRGPRVDIHSGIYGGLVRNPLQALASVIGSMYREDGSVAVPGFYDGAAEPTERDQELALKAPVNVKDVEALLGVPLAGGESRFPPMVRRGFRPTLEINGIGGGYQGDGGKTIIPSYGKAKFSMRLVAGQDPHRILANVVDFLKQAAPAGISVEIADDIVGGAAFQLPMESPVVRIAETAVQNAFGKPPVYVWEGASVPIIPLLAKASGAAPILVGFGLQEDNIHSPNESYSIAQFEGGFLYASSFFQVL
jgi:acetylornithine deacetylase/succinyl-diaminopimelate desuccinylase-like protein